MSAEGWRLTLEPCGDLVAWSLIHAEDTPASEVAVWSGLVEDAAALRELATSAIGDGGAPLASPAQEATIARELGAGLLPAVLQNALLSSRGNPLVTLCTRGWLSRVPWEALAVGRDGVRLVQTCLLLGGLAPGLLDRQRPPLRQHGTDGRPGLWIVDAGPPDGPWPPLFPSGYPEAVRSLVPADGRIVPDGLGLSVDELAAELARGPWELLVYLGHIGMESASPASAGLVLGKLGAETLTAHAWLRSPGRWPAPARVALLGCGSDDSAPLEQTGLVTAAINAGAELVTSTRWSLANDDGTLRLVGAVSAALAEDNVLAALRRWQVSELDSWRRTGHPWSSPLYWASLVTYDRSLLAAGAGAA